MIGDRKPYGSILLALAVTALAPASIRADEADPRPDDHLIERTRRSMGTLVQLSVWGSDDETAVRAMDEAFAEFERLDRLMTTWTETSDVARINAAAGSGAPVRVAPEVIACLTRADQASRRSGGAFDVTVGAFAGVWKFDEDNDGSIPPPELVAERRRLVAFRDLVIDRRQGTARLRRPGQKITLGGIAKGYAVDRAAAILRRHGLSDFMVQAGGDLFVAGRRGDRRWRVGVRDPRGPRDAFFAAVEVEDRSFSTSGDYERFTVADGRRYHHILDPRTGYPAVGTRSVTIMAPDAVTAETMSKIVFIRGPAEGLPLVEKTAGVEAVVVGADNQVHVSSGLRGKLIMLSRPSEGI
jgi:FAD:protein FMN transferase